MAKDDKFLKLNKEAESAEPAKVILHKESGFRRFYRKATGRPWRTPTTEDIIFVAFLVIFLFCFTVITLYPIINTVAVSFSNGLVATMGDVYLLPKMPTFENYQKVFAKDNIVRGFWVTILRTVIGTFFSLVANSFLAFIISRKKYLFRNSFSLFWVITMYLNGGLIPGILLVRMLGLMSTFWVYVIPGMVSAFFVMVLRTYMEGLPEELEESAMLDGAGYIRIFFSIITPLCLPVYATVALFQAVYQWNAWFDAMLYNKTKAKWTTLQYELQKLLSSVMNQGGGVTTSNGQTGSQVTPISMRAAASVVTIVPIVMIYPFLQRYFVTGLTIGGVKG